MSLLPVGFGASGDDYEITDSLRFRESADANLARTFSTPTDGKVWTYSVWVKRSKNPVTAGHGMAHLLCTAGSGAQANFGFGWNNIDDIVFTFAGYARRYTTGLFRDPSAWYHILLKVDTTQATEANRALLYVNGALFPWNTNTSISQNSTTQINQAVAHSIGDQTGQPYKSFDGYMTEANFIDGQALDPTDFGEYDANGTWKAKKYKGTYGTNGFYLPMKPTTQAELQNTVLYTGNGGSQSIDGYGFTPDFVWIKERSSTSGHSLFDTLRGAGKYLGSHSTSAENTSSTQLTSFDTDGFTTGLSGGTNQSGQTYVAWGWDAGDNQPSTGHSSILYKGSGGAISLKGFGFSPDLVWIKNRDGTAQNHMVFDSVRGPNLRIQPDATATEYDQVGSLTSFDTDGFSFGTSTGNLNATSSNYVAWGWDAGDGDPVSNTTGDINSTVKASDATGFSIVSYTGNGTSNSEQTIGHGLSTAPSVVIVKNRTSATRWQFYSTDLSSSATTAVKNLLLNSSNAESSYTSQIRGIQASNTFSVRDVDANGNGMVNKNGNNYIAYCFSEVSGVSKFDSYTGTGSTDGPTITTGFRPGFLLIKNATSSESWQLIDSTRSPFNNVEDVLFPNSSSAEVTTSAVTTEFLSDGFKIRAASGNTNDSGQTYIYMAFKGSYSDYVSPLNDTGTIDSRVKANPDKGFSIVSYEGTGGATDTIGHGLSSTPEMVIVKDRGASNFWAVYHVGVDATAPEDYLMRLNTTDAKLNGSVYWNDTAPTSSVFTVGTSSALNAVSSYIAYCFHSVAGYSKLGNYTGTGSAGNSVTTGFRPGWVMVKRTNAAANWIIFDNARTPSDTATDYRLFPDVANAEATGEAFKFTDTGFELTGTQSSSNASGSTYIYMAFADTADARFNFDASGNKNNWLPNNINSNAESETTYDLMKDTPSLVDENAGNFATLNPLNEPRPYVTYSDANLTVINTTANLHSPFISTIGMAPNSGKYYWESIGVGNSNTRNATGIGTAESMGSTTLPVGFISDQAGFYIGGAARIYFENQGTTGVFDVAWEAGNVLMHCYDANTGKFWAGQNGVWYNSTGGTTGDPATGANPTATLTSSNTYFPLGTVYNNSGSYLYYNFGQRPLAYTPPTGFLKLNTFNLPDSTIEDGSDYFNPVLYTGDSTSNRNIPTGFAGGWTWIKNRNLANSHTLSDVVRGDGKTLFTNATNAEVDYGANGIDLVSDGFDVTHSATNNLFNVSGRTYVAWNWKANGSGVSNTDGSITSTVSANTTAGFSVVSYTGTGSASTVGHGLTSAPEMIIVKDRDRVTEWPVMAQAANSGNGHLGWLRLNGTYAWGATSILWNNTAPTSSVFSIGTYDYVNFNNSKYIAYCFAPVEGYSSFGSYTGNGSNDGPFIYTGFKPAFVIFKSSNQTTNWMMFDATVNPVNEAKSQLWPNLANAENTNSVGLDFVSNGIKLRGALTATNAATSYSYIYMAFAENPFKNSNAR